RIAEPFAMEALIDHPREGHYSGTSKIRLQATSFVNGCCFRQSDEQDPGERGIAQTGKQVSERLPACRWSSVELPDGKPPPNRAAAGCARWELCRERRTPPCLRPPPGRKPGIRQSLRCRVISDLLRAALCLPSLVRRQRCPSLLSYSAASQRGDQSG